MDNLVNNWTIIEGCIQEMLSMRSGGLYVSLTSFGVGTTHAREGRVVRLDESVDTSRFSKPLSSNEDALNMHQ